MTGRVEEDSPSVRRWLRRRDPGAQPLGLGGRGVEIGHRQVEVDLLGHVAVGPRRGHVVGIFRAVSHTQSVRTPTVVALVNLISPPSIAAQNSPSVSGSAQSNETKPLRATAIEKG